MIPTILDFVSLLSGILSHTIVTCSSLSGRLCSCQYPMACPTKGRDKQRNKVSRHKCITHEKPWSRFLEQPLNVANLRIFKQLCPLRAEEGKWEGGGPYIEFSTNLQIFRVHLYVVYKPLKRRHTHFYNQHLVHI